jgi:hypothetical protein
MEARRLMRIAIPCEVAIVAILESILGFSFCAGAPVAEGQPGGPDTWTVGTPWLGSPGYSETTAEIMSRQEQVELRSAPDLISPRRAQPRPRLRADRERVPQNPESSALDQRIGTQTPAAVVQGVIPTLSQPQALGVSFLGATLADSGDFPPDSMGAVGPTQFLVGINGRIRVFDKSTGGMGALNANMDVFFHSVRNGQITSDPRVRYDRLSGRWFVTIINVTVDGSGNITGPNRVLIAVSDGSVIAGGTVWTYFSFQQDQVLPVGDSTSLSDYPTLGIDANALYIGVNQFAGIGTQGSFNGTAAFVVRKSSVLGPGPIVVTAFRNLTGTPTGPGPYTPQGVDNYDPAATEGYFIGVDNATFGTLMVRRISTPGGTPSISGNIAIAVPSTRFPIPVPHLGNTSGANGELDSLDDRLFAAHIRNGRLWTAHNIGTDQNGVASVTPSRVAVRWYQLQNFSGTPSIVQSGTIFDPAATSPLFYWIPSVMVSGQGHVAFGFSTAGSNAFADGATTGMLAGGVVATPVKYTNTSAAYNPPGDPGGRNGRRWGDFSYTSLDPDDDMTMWTVQEFTSSTNIWGVQVVKLLAPAPTLNNPATTGSQGQSGISVSLSGTGFYDPGSGFSNRLSASISGAGVTVANVTYNSPTSVTITVNVAAGAVAGARNITITNPDGQSTTVAGGFTVVVPPTLVTVVPDRGATVNSLPSVEVTFSEVVSGVVAADLTVNGSPATNVNGSGAGPYTFTGYATPAYGTVNVALGSGAIKNAANNSFAGDTWSVIDVHLVGDINNDGHVNTLDLLLLAAAFGSVTGDPNYSPACDLDHNGSVDVVDLLYLADNWGT